MMGAYNRGLRHGVLDGFLEEVVFQQRTEQWIRISKVRRRERGWIRALEAGGSWLAPGNEKG